jgi:uncharacterized membrane protein YgcG
VARRAGDRWTQKLATPEYMAPEIAGGQPPTPAADVYALGIVLYELVCGRSPFRGGTSAEIIRRHAGCVAVPAPGVPAQLWALIEPCLRPDPLLRPAAAEVAAALRAVAAGLVGVPPVAPLPPDAVTYRPRVAETTRFGETPAAMAPAAMAHAALAPGAMAHAGLAPTGPAPARGRLRTRLLVGAAVAVVATFLTGGGVAAANGVFSRDGAGRPPGAVVEGPATAPSAGPPAAPSAVPSGPADDPTRTPSGSGSSPPDTGGSGASGSDGSDGSDGSGGSGGSGASGTAGSRRPSRPGSSDGGSPGDLIGGPMPRLPRR